MNLCSLQVHIFGSIAWNIFIFQSKNDIDGALNKYKLIDVESQKSAEIWNNVGLCFLKKKKFIAVISFILNLDNNSIGIDAVANLVILGHILFEKIHMDGADQF